MRMFRLSVSAAVVAAAVSPAFAQEGDPGERLLERQAREQQLEDLARNQAGQVISVPQSDGPVAEEACFPIDVIHVTGVTAVNEGEFEALIEEFSGQCLGQVSIGNLLQRISAVYADKGFITTRAYVPVQDISSRELTIEVLGRKG